MNTEVLIHIRSEERENSTEQGPQDGIRGEHRSSVDGVGVDQVVHYTEEDEHHAETERGCANDTHAPVDAGGVGPGEPENSDRKTDGSEEARGETGFRGGAGCATCSFRSVGDPVVTIVIRDGIDDGGHHADSHTDEREAANAFVPAAALLKNDGESGEEHIQCSVYDGHVYTEEEHDGFSQEEYPRTREGGFEKIGDGGTRSGLDF